MSTSRGTSLRASRQKLGATPPQIPLLLDANVFINALAGRAPPMLRTVLDTSRRLHMSAPTRAELTWLRGRLDPDHPRTAALLGDCANLLARIDPANVLVPGDAEWLAAGALAGAAARAMAGGGKRIATAFDRVELISDALTAIVAVRAGVTVVTEDADFDVLAQLLPGLSVLFYDRPSRPIR